MEIIKLGAKSLASQQAKIEMQLCDQLESVLISMFPKGLSSSGEFQIGDVSGKAGKSLNVCLIGDKRGVWHDFSTGQSGKILDLIAAHFQLDIKSALVDVFARAKEVLASAATIPKNMPSEVKIVTQNLMKIAEWDYLKEDGSYAWTVVRFKDAAGEKQIRPFDKNTNKFGAHPTPRPIFNLPSVCKSQYVILVEGEKCAQALINAGHCATTMMGGANAPTANTDWTPFSKKQVAIWPDNDEPGKKYAENCAQAILAAGAISCEILVPPDDKPPKWDVADALEEDFDVDDYIKNGPRILVAIDETLAFKNNLKADYWRTEDGVADAFAQLHGNDWKYCHPWRTWLRWDGSRWVSDKVLTIRHLIRQVACAASEVSEKGTKAKLASAAMVASIEKLSQADPRFASSVEQWDADLMVLNCPGGVVDLKTGELLPADPKRFLTKMATATPGGYCPQWLAFLQVVTVGNQELIDYLQRVIGYCLTGLTTEHALFFLYGTGANGKSVFLNVISEILGDYAKTAPMETFIDTRSDRHPTELAGLCGARVVCANETEQGRRWNESKIKAITGGDLISARFMKKDFFEFKPQFKLLIAGNHKPSISNVDEAMSRRIHLIPFNACIPPEKRDKHLTEKLLGERNGILAWAIEGLNQWRKLGGLFPPEVVTAATKEYLADEDTLACWMEDRCILDPSVFTPTSELFKSWSGWAEENGEYVGKSRGLSNKLVARGFKRPDSVKKDRGFFGLRIKKYSDILEESSENVNEDLASEL